MLKIGNKIYYIDYEESKASYTIVGISKVINNKFQKDGFYYDIHSDLLSNATGYYSIPINVVDSDNLNTRFFSSPVLAHIAYSKFKKKIKKINEN